MEYLVEPMSISPANDEICSSLCDAVGSPCPALCLGICGPFRWQ